MSIKRGCSNVAKWISRDCSRLGCIRFPVKINVDLIPKLHNFSPNIRMLHVNRSFMSFGANDTSMLGIEMCIDVFECNRNMQLCILTVQSKITRMENYSMQMNGRPWRPQPTFGECDSIQKAVPVKHATHPKWSPANWHFRTAGTRLAISPNRVPKSRIELQIERAKQLRGDFDQTEKEKKIKPTFSIWDRQRSIGASHVSP